MNLKTSTERFLRDVIISTLPDSWNLANLQTGWQLPSGPENVQLGLVKHCQSKEGEIGEFWDIESWSIQILAEKGSSKELMLGFGWKWRGEIVSCNSTSTSCQTAYDAPPRAYMDQSLASFFRPNSSVRRSICQDATLSFFLWLTGKKHSLSTFKPWLVLKSLFPVIFVASFSPTLSVSLV